MLIYIYMFSIVSNYRKYIHMKRFFQIKELETRSNNDLSLKGFFCYFIFPGFFFFLRLSNGLEKKKLFNLAQHSFENKKT